MVLDFFDKSDKAGKRKADEEIAKILNEMMDKHPLCQGLIDQNRKIGNDPVGFKCSNWAQGIMEVPIEGESEVAMVPVCDRCYTMIRDEPHRIEMYHGQRKIIFRKRDIPE